MVNETSKLMNCTCITPNGSLVNRIGKGSISNKTSTVKNCMCMMADLTSMGKNGMGMMQMGMMGNNMTAKSTKLAKPITPVKG